MFEFPPIIPSLGKCNISGVPGAVAGATMRQGLMAMEFAKMIGKQMSDMDPRTWNPQYQIALILAIVVGIALGGVVGLAANELQGPAFCSATRILD